MNRSSILLGCLLLLFQTSSPAPGQTAVDTTASAATTDAATTTEAALVTKDPAGLAIAQQAMAAMAGTQGVPGYQDSLTTGTLTLPGDKPKTFSVALKTKGTQQLRVELTSADGTRVRVLKQGQAAIQYPDGKIRKLLMNNTLTERVSHLPIFSLLAESNDPSVIAEHVGAARMAGGATANVIALRPVPIPGMSQADLDRTTTKTWFYIDQLSGMATKTEYFLFAENDPDEKAKVETYFSDFRSINGVWVPFHQMTYEDGKLAEDLVLTSVAFNAGVSDTEFTVPTEVANAQ